MIRNLCLMFHGPGLWMYWPRISQNNFDLFCLPNAMIQEPRAVTLDRNLAHVSTLLDYFFLMIGHARLDVPIMPFCLFCFGPSCGLGQIVPMAWRCGRVYRESRKYTDERQLADRWSVADLLHGRTAQDGGWDELVGGRGVGQLPPGGRLLDMGSDCPRCL